MRKPSSYKSLGDLKKLWKEEVKQKGASSIPPTPSLPPPPPPTVKSDEEAFTQAMEDVISLGWSEVPLPESRPVEIQNPLQSEDEGLRLLKEFVAGKGQFEIWNTAEYVEGASHPEGRHWLKDLRRGHFSVQAHLDLHGATRAQARDLLENFIRHSLVEGFGCVRIIHGRGQHSETGQAVLKEHVQKWLDSRRLSRHVVAYTSARLRDGGGGALYVLLGRKPQ
jgi:DNA-nicking Smr family endonuclease